MIILDYLKAYRSLVTFLVILIGPRLIPSIPSLFASRRNPPNSPPPPPRPPTPHQLTALLLLSTAYHLNNLINPPYDLFISNHIPIFAPNSIVRQILHPTTPSRQVVYPPPAAEDAVELLFQKLQTFDSRLNYARFGHGTMTNCIWCEVTNDYAIYALPGVLAPYVASALLLGVLGWKSVSGLDARRRAKQWRLTLGAVVGALAIGEIALRCSWPLRAVDGDTTHLSSTLFTIRHATLLLIPLIYTILPLPAPPPDFQALAQTLQHTRNTIRMTSISRTALMRHEGLRRQWISTAEEETGRVRAVRSDPDVQQAILDGHLPVNDVRQSSKRWVRDGWSSLIRVEG